MIGPSSITKVQPKQSTSQVAPDGDLIEITV